MAFTYGFYNSINHDRRYDARQFSKLFNGILNDGVFQTVGDHFAVTPRSKMTVSVGTGRAWFNGTWSDNDTPMIISIPESGYSTNRIDAIVLEIDKRKNYRRNRIKVVRGPNSFTDTPSKPTLTQDSVNEIYQYALAYVTVRPKIEEITALDIENYVGKGDTPYANSMMEVYNVDAIWSQWEARFEEWFKSVRDMLSGDIAGNLSGQIQKLIQGPRVFTKITKYIDDNELASSVLSYPEAYDRAPLGSVCIDAYYKEYSQPIKMVNGRYVKRQTSVVAWVVVSVAQRPDGSFYNILAQLSGHGPDYIYFDDSEV